MSRHDREGEAVTAGERAAPTAKRWLIPAPPNRSLTQEEFIRAALACDLNARDLLREAELLLGNDCHARALALACVGLEEIGKVEVCIGLYHGDDRFERYRPPEGFWRFWQNHGRKSARGILGLDSNPVDADLSVEGLPLSEEEAARAVETLTRLHALAKDASQFLVQARESALYVDLSAADRPGDPSLVVFPQKSVPRVHAEGLIARLRERLEHIRPLLDLLPPPTPPGARLDAP